MHGRQVKHTLTGALPHLHHNPSRQCYMFLIARQRSKITNACARRNRRRRPSKRHYLTDFAITCFVDCCYRVFPWYPLIHAYLLIENHAHSHSAVAGAGVPDAG